MKTTGKRYGELHSSCFAIEQFLRFHILLINSMLRNFPFCSIVALKIYGLVIPLDISKISIAITLAVSSALRKSSLNIDRLF